MGTSVRKLDKSGWTPEMLARGEALEAERRAWKASNDERAAHPLAGALGGLDEAADAATRAPRWVGTEKVFGNGCRRIVIRKVCPDPERALDRVIGRELVAGRVDEPTDDDREEWRKRNARRARSTVVDKAIAAGMNALHTLTFRENLLDLDEALRCFDLYRRKCQKLLPGWRYVVCWQRQERGAWHFHLATYRLPRLFTERGVKVNSWDVMRRLWRQCAGEHGGNFDEARERRRNGARMPLKTAARIARYIGRYIGRDIGDSLASEKGRKAFATSKGIELPTPQRYLWDGDDRWAELMTWALGRLPEQGRSYWFSPEIEVFFVECDAPVSATVAPS